MKLKDIEIISDFIPMGQRQPQPAPIPMPDGLRRRPHKLYRCEDRFCMTMMEEKTHIEALKYRALLHRVDGWMVSYRKAVRIVGGEKHLERLMLEGKVRHDKPLGAMNTRWRIPLTDVIRNVKPTELLDI